VEAALTTLVEKITALEEDRAEESALPVEERDTAWLTRAALALRKASITRNDLLKRGGDLRRADKAAEQQRREQEVSRERLFIEAAREVLDRTTYLAVWEAVDRRTALRLNGVATTPASDGEVRREGEARTRTTEPNFPAHPDQTGAG
jgi:hypothetical protein